MASAPSGVTAVGAYYTAQVVVSWTPNGPYVEQVVERQAGDGTGAVTTVATLSGTATTTTDATVALDTYYQYRVKGTTSGGTTYTSGWVKAHTAPAPVTNYRATRSTAAVVLNWTVNSASAQVGYRVVRELPPWNSGQLSTIGTTAAGASTITDNSPPATGEVRYSIYPYFIAGGYTLVNGSQVLTIGAPATPYAPTVTPSAFALNLATTALVLAVQHNSKDSSAQTSGNLRYRAVGATTWTTVALGTSASYTIPAGTLANGSDYEFQAQTAGMTTTLSNWSSSVVVAGATTPVATLTAPANGSTVGTGTVTVTWTYSDGSGRPQSGYRVALKVAGTQVDGIEGSGAGLSWTSAALLNATNYTVEVQVQNSAGLWSAVASRTFSTLFPLPPVPTVVAAFDPDTGAATLTITNPAPGGGQGAAVSNNVYRDGAIIAEGLAVNSTYTDNVPPLNASVSYRVEAVTASPSVDSTTLSVDTTLGDNRWVFLNGGDGFGILGRMREQVTITAGPEPTRSLVWFEGRTLPTEYAGQQIARSFRVSGEVQGMGADTNLIGTWEPFAQLAELPAPLVFRDPLGRRLVCSTSGWSITHSSNGPEASVAYTVTEVDA